MSLYINNNSMSLAASRHLSVTSAALERSMAKLSSGLRIERASDDPSGVGVSGRLRAQINGLSFAKKCVEEGRGMLEIADAALGEVASKLQRIRDLGLQYNSGTLDTNAQNAIISEVVAISAELDAIAAGSVAYNGVTLVGGAVAFNVISDADGNTTTINFADVTTGFGLNGEVATFAGLAPPAGVVNLTNLDATLGAINNERARIGAEIGMLDSTVAIIDSQSENLQAAESRIRDVDVAEEMANLTRLQVLQQSGVAMLAQANMNPAALMSALFGA